MKPPQNLPQSSPADLKKQTAVVCKDNGFFILTKPSLCQNLPRYSRPRPSHCRSLRSQWCVFSVCDTDDMNSNATNKTRTGPKRVRTQEPEDEQETHHILRQVRQRKPPKMLSKWQLRRSLQAYNH